MEERYTPSKFGKRDLNSVDHWKQLDIENYSITKPTIICLGGNGTITERKANNFCKLAERLVGLKIESDNVYSSYNNVEVLGFSYGSEKEEDTAGQFNKEDINSIVDSLLLPLLINEDGKRLSMEQASKNFSLVTFFSHCHGAREVANLISSLNKKLTIASYSQEEIDQILGQTFQLAYCPNTDEAPIPTVRIDSFTDSHNLELPRIFKDAYGYTVDGIDIKYDPPGYLRNQKRWFQTHSHSDIVSVVSSRLLNFQEPTIDPSLDMQDPQNRPQVVDEHNIYDVFKRDKDSWADETGAKNADTVSQMAAHTLALSVANSMANSESETLIPKMPLTEIKEYLEDIKQTYKPEEIQRQK